jgi:hypothetical protein
MFFISRLRFPSKFASFLLRFPRFPTLDLLRFPNVATSLPLLRPAQNELRRRCTMVCPAALFTPQIATKTPEITAEKIAKQTFLWNKERFLRFYVSLCAIMLYLRRRKENIAPYPQITDNYNIKT